VASCELNSCALNIIYVHENDIRVHTPSIQLREDKLELVNFESLGGEVANVMAVIEDSDSVTRRALTSESLREDCGSNIGVTGKARSIRWGVLDE